MKKKDSPIIVYVLLLIIIVGGLLLFIFRDQAVNWLRIQSGVDSAAQVSIISSTVTHVASSTVLDTDILKSPRFTSLVNSVNNFNFDNVSICKM